MAAKKSISVEEFDKLFDEGKEDILDYLDLDQVVRINQQKNDLKRVNVDFPLWMIDGLDKEADRLAINRQAVIKTWIAERLDKECVA